MSLFSKGPWVHLHINPDTLPSFKALLEDSNALFRMSAFAARTKLLGNSELPSTMGINPPCWPCGDAPMPREQQVIDKRIHPHVAGNLGDPECTTPWAIPSEVQEDTGIFLEGDRYWGNGPHVFQLLDAATPVYGLWLVLLKRANLDDLNALKEHAAATTAGQPFKTLSPSARKDVGSALNSDGLVTYIDRKQVPVIIDYRTGDIWLGNAGKSFIEALTFFLMGVVGAKPEPMGCCPGKNASWTALALTAFHDQDINKLEREEAFQEATSGKASPETGETDPEGEEAPAEDDIKFTITDIATFASDSGVSVSVQPDACLCLPGARPATVSAHYPMDALTILHLQPDAMISAARTDYLWEIDGAKAKASVDMTVELGACTYKGLEIDFAPAAHATLEKDVAGNLFGFEELEAKGAAPRVNRYWFRYLIALGEVERIIFSTACEALGLETVMPSVDRGVMAEEATPAEEHVVAGAVAESLKAHLLPGETVTVTTPSMSRKARGASAVETEIL